MSGPLPSLVLHGEGPVSRKRVKRERPHKVERRETMWAARNDDSETQSVCKDVARRTTFPSLPSDEETSGRGGDTNYWKQRK